MNHKGKGKHELAPRETGQPKEHGPWPFGDFREIMEGLRHDFDDALRGMWPRLGHSGMTLRPFGQWRMPRVDIEDTGAQYRVKAELPGIPRDKVQISVTENHLEIKADAGSEKEEKKKGYYYHEIGRQSFFRSLPLPSDADPGKVDARMENGNLEVIIGKKLVTVKRKTVPVK